MSIEEKQLGKLYEVIANEDTTGIIPEDKAKKLILSKNVTKEAMADYLTTMANQMMPRQIRDEGRDSTDVEVYAIPTNYYSVSTNMVNFNLNEGFYKPNINAEEGQATIFGKNVKVYNGYEANDLGTFICLYLFQHGRKTVDEIVKELSSYDETFLNLLLNKLQDDDFIKPYKEKDGLETFEILTKKERDELNQKRLKALDNQSA